MCFLVWHLNRKSTAVLLFIFRGVLQKIKVCRRIVFFRLFKFSLCFPFFNVKCFWNCCFVADSVLWIVICRPSNTISTKLQYFIIFYNFIILFPLQLLLFLLFTVTFIIIIFSTSNVVLISIINTTVVVVFWAFLGIANDT